MKAGLTSAPCAPTAAACATAVCCRSTASTPSGCWTPTASTISLPPNRISRAGVLILSDKVSATAVRRADGLNLGDGGYARAVKQRHHQPIRRADPWKPGRPTSSWKGPRVNAGGGGPFETLPFAQSTSPFRSVIISTAPLLSNGRRGVLARTAGGISRAAPDGAEPAGGCTSAEDRGGNGA